MRHDRSSVWVHPNYQWKWRQGEHINYPHERGRGHRGLLVIKTLLPPLGTLCWVSQQCPLAKLITCTAEPKIDALGAGEPWSWEGFRRICPKETLELNSNQDFWKGLFLFTWDGNAKHWDSTGELVLMEFSIPLLGHSAPESFEGTPALYLLDFLQKSTGGTERAQVTAPVPNIPPRWKCPG